MEKTLILCISFQQIRLFCQHNEISMHVAKTPHIINKNKF